MKEFLTKDGKKVKEGKVIVKLLSTPFGMVPVGIIELDEKSIPELIKQGVLTEVKPASLSIQDCVEHLAKRIKWSSQNLIKYLNNLYEIYPAVAFSVILKELAILIDEKYPDHISNSKEIWTIGYLNGKVHRIQDPSSIKSFKNFAAFRTLEDALEAKRIMKEILDDLFEEGGE